MPVDKSVFDYNQSAKRPPYQPQWTWWETALWDVVYPIAVGALLIKAIVMLFHKQPEIAFFQLLIAVFVFCILMARQRWIMIQNGTWETELSKAKAERKAERKANRKKK